MLALKREEKKFRKKKPVLSSQKVQLIREMEERERAALAAAGREQERARQAEERLGEMAADGAHAGHADKALWRLLL